MSTQSGAKLNKNFAKWYSIFLKFERKSFEPIDALRAKYFVPSKRNPTQVAFPCIRLYNNLPRNLGENYKSSLSEICARIAPFRVPVGELQIRKDERLQKNNETGVITKIDEISTGFTVSQDGIEEVHSALRESLRDLILAETKRNNVPTHLARADPLKPKDKVGNKVLKVQGFLDQSKAEEIVDYGKSLYPDGVGPLIAEGLVLQYVDLGKQLKGLPGATTVAEYKFGASPAS